MIHVSVRKKTKRTCNLVPQDFVQWNQKGKKCLMMLLMTLP